MNLLFLRAQLKDIMAEAKIKKKNLNAGLKMEE